MKILRRQTYRNDLLCVDTFWRFETCCTEHRAQSTEHREEYVSICIIYCECLEHNECRTKWKRKRQIFLFPFSFLWSFAKQNIKHTQNKVKWNEWYHSTTKHTNNNKQKEEIKVKFRFRFDRWFLVIIFCCGFLFCFCNSKSEMMKIKSNDVFVHHPNAKENRIQWNVSVYTVVVRRMTDAPHT